MKDHRIWTVKVDGKTRGIFTTKDGEDKAQALCNKVAANGQHPELHEFQLTKRQYKDALKTIRQQFKPYH
jgi:hypothetical protein